MRIKAFDFWLLAKAAVTLLLCLVTTIGFANPDMIFNGLEYEYKYEKKRVIDANFEAKANYNLYLNGKYSDYKIVTWNENRVSFHVEIIVKSNREDVAKEAVNNIDVEFNNRKDEATIEARTVFKKYTFKNISYEIDYYVMIPKDLYLVIDNSYGNVEIDKLNKTLDLRLDYGNFSIWHKEADLWMMDLQTGKQYPLTAINSNDTESFHNWSSNSRWCVFSSRREDGRYTRLYLAHIDEQGVASKPFLLPQENPVEYYLELPYSYNVPDFINAPIKVDTQSLSQAILSDERVQIQADAAK